MLDHPIEDANGLYVFKAEIYDLLDLHKGYRVGRDALREWVKDRFNGSFKNDYHSDTRARRPVPRVFLVYLLVWLKECSSFDQECLGADWSSLTPMQLAETYTTPVPNGHDFKPKREDLIIKGPLAVASDLFTKIHYEGKPRPARQSDAEQLALVMAVAAGDLDCEDHLAPPDVAREIGLELMGMSLPELTEFMRGCISYCADSIWLREHSEKGKWLMTQVIPLHDEDYLAYRDGNLADASIIRKTPCENSKNLLLWGLAGDARNGKRPKAVKDLMFMMLRQIGLLSPPIQEHGINLLSFYYAGSNLRQTIGMGFPAVEREKPDSRIAVGGASSRQQAVVRVRRPSI